MKYSECTVGSVEANKHCPIPIDVGSQVRMSKAENKEVSCSEEKKSSQTMSKIYSCPISLLFVFFYGNMAFNPSENAIDFSSRQNWRSVTAGEPKQ